MRDAQGKLAAEGFQFDLDFYVRCTSSVATGAGYYEPLYRTPVEEIQAAWERMKPALEYLVNVLRFDALVSSSSNLATDMVLVPLVVYLAMRKESEYVAANAREALNFHISVFIYGICCIPLVFIIIGIPLIIGLVIGSFVLAIIAAVKASDGEVYRYPLTIRLVS